MYPTPIKSKSTRKAYVFNDYSANENLDVFDDCNCNCDYDCSCYNDVDCVCGYDCACNFNNCIEYEDKIVDSKYNNSVNNKNNNKNSGSKNNRKNNKNANSGNLNHSRDHNYGDGPVDKNVSDYWMRFDETAHEQWILKNEVDGMIAEHDRFVKRIDRRDALNNEGNTANSGSKGANNVPDCVK